MNHVVTVVQARLASTRLPGKALLDVAGKPMLAHVIERALAIPGVAEVVLTTPPEDAEALLKAIPLVPWAPHWPPDVLGGYVGAALGSDATHVLRLTGDCPLLAVDLAGETLTASLAGGFDYYATTRPDTTRCLDGWDVEVMRRSALESAHRWARGLEREHVTAHLYAHPEVFLCGQPAPVGDAWARGLKLSVDTSADLLRVRLIAECLPPKNYTMAAVLQAAKELAL